MELNIEGKEDGRSIVLDLSGDLIFGECNTKLRSTLRDYLTKGYNDVSLDLADVEHLDSSGIGELISSLIAVSREGGELVLLNPPARVHQLLEISQLTDIFEIEYTEH